MELAGNLTKFATLKAAVEENAGTISPAANDLINGLFDQDTFVEIGAFTGRENNNSGVITGYGSVEGFLVFAYAQDKNILSGAVGRMMAEKICNLYEMAGKAGAPVVALFDSEGASLKEGLEVLNAYSKLIQASNRLSGVVPQVAVVLGSCIGSAAMLASGADFVIKEQDASFYMTSPDVVSSYGADCQEGHMNGQTVSFTEQGRGNTLRKARELLTYLPSNHLALSVSDYPDSLNMLSEEIMPDLPMEELLKQIFDPGSYLESLQVPGAAVRTGIARLGGFSVGVVGAEGLLCEADCTKASSMVRFCDAFGIPIITVLNSEGFAPGLSSRSAAKLAGAYAEATSPKLTLVSGNAYGSLFVALAGKSANTDLIFAWTDAVISTLPPETAVRILWNDRLEAMQNPFEEREKLIAEYKLSEASAFRAAEAGMVDMIITPKETRGRLFSALDVMIAKKTVLLPKRHTSYSV